MAGVLTDGTSRLRAADGTVLQHGLSVACFAEYAVVSAGAAIPISPDVPLWQAALLGCGVVTAFGAVTHAAGVRIGERVCVIGCGGVGLQVIAALRLAGAAAIVAVDRRPEKLEHALRRGESLCACWQQLWQRSFPSVRGRKPSLRLFPAPSPTRVGPLSPASALRLSARALD